LRDVETLQLFVAQIDGKWLRRRDSFPLRQGYSGQVKRPPRLIRPTAN